MSAAVCVLNLLPDKGPAFREMARVLKPGGRFCISDIVASGPLPDHIREVAALYVGCVAGALPEKDYLALIHAAGFESVRVAKTQTIRLPDDILLQYFSVDDIAAFRASGLEL